MVWGFGQDDFEAVGESAVSPAWATQQRAGGRVRERWMRARGTLFGKLFGPLRRLLLRRPAKYDGAPRRVEEFLRSLANLIGRYFQESAKN